MAGVAGAGTASTSTPLSPKKEITLTVKWSRKEHTVKVYGDDTVGELKRRICQLTTVLPKRQKHLLTHHRHQRRQRRSSSKVSRQVANLWCQLFFFLHTKTDREKEWQVAALPTTRVDKNPTRIQEGPLHWRVWCKRRQQMWIVLYCRQDVKIT
ncbi:hypothetical protein ACFX2F_021757 [Malus domestica]